MAGRSTFLSLGCALSLVGAVAVAQVDAPNVNQAIQSADELFDRLEARRPIASDDKDLSRVEARIQEISTADPDNVHLLFLRGRHLALTGRTGDASIKLLQFVETPQGKTEWRAFRLLGDMLLDEFPQLAKSNYKKASTLSPGEASVLFGLSVCEMKLGNVERGVALAGEAVKADGRSTIRYVSHLATALQAAEHSDEARLEAENALRMAEREAERNPFARQSLEGVQAQLTIVMSILQARIRTKRGDVVNDYLRFDTCVRQLNRVKEKITLHDWLTVVESRIQSSEPKPVPAMLRMYGVLLSDVGRTDDAIDALERVLELDPQDAKAKASLTKLRKTVSTRK